ncbi:MAG: YfbM family protein [Firmicutes bacterium]|nr:YfbM family protein [Bacillota bacterium]
MSMIGNLRRLSEADRQRLFEAPHEITSYLYENPPKGDGPFRDLEIDKVWHGIHYLLTGSAWEGESPLGFLVNGGTAVGDEDVGYGPARGFSAKEVRAIAEALAGIDAATLRARFDSQAMMEAGIYPLVWDRPLTEDDTLGYLLEYFEQLREFIAGAAAAGDALLVYIN